MSADDLWMLGLFAVLCAVLAAGIIIGYGMGREAQADVDEELLRAQARRISHLQRGGMRR